MLICVTVLILNHDLFSYFHRVYRKCEHSNSSRRTGSTTRRRTSTTGSVPHQWYTSATGSVPHQWYTSATGSVPPQRYSLIRHRVCSPQWYTSATGSVPPQWYTSATGSVPPQWYSLIHHRVCSPSVVYIHHRVCSPSVVCIHHRVCSPSVVLKIKCVLCKKIYRRAPLIDKHWLLFWTICSNSQTCEINITIEYKLCVIVCR